MKVKLLVAGFAAVVVYGARAAEDWYSDAKLGMFVHWGLYAADGQGEWAMFRNGIAPEDYARHAETWNPEVGCEERWVKMAKDAGVRYMVLTTRHHDGFSLWDTKTDAFNSMNTPAKRDHVRAYVEACRKHGMKVGFYYSLVDWRLRDTDPAKMKANAWAQLEELMTKYGKIDVLWYDGSWHPKDMTTAEFWESEKLNARIREWQPGILMNDRAGTDEDFRTIEGRNIPRPPKGAAKWESCLTLQDDDWSFWGWCRHTAFRKTPEQIVCQLLHCLELGGNLLVNVGPDAQGEVDAWQRDLFAKVGGWTARNADAVYGTRPTEIATPRPLAGGWTGNSCGFFTVKPGRDDACLFFHAWPGTETTFPHFTAEVKSIELDGRPVAFEQDLAAKRLTLKGLPASAPDLLCTVLRLKLGRRLATPKESSFMVRDDGTKVTDVPGWKPRMLEITRKYERTDFGMMPPRPDDLKVECLAETKDAFGGKATVKRLRFGWGRAYDKGSFEATAVLPNRSGSAASFLYVREKPVAAMPASEEDWPVEEIVRRGYATVAFDGSQLTAANARDAVSQRAWALRLLYDWAKDEPRIDEMTTGPVGCGPLDGVAALWAGSYDWRFYLCVAAQCGLDASYAELAANNTPGLLYTCSCTAESAAEIAGDRALAEDVTPAWTIYGGLKGFRGNTDWHLRDGRRGLVREDWTRIMDFTDRHGWAIGDTQKPADSVPALGDRPREETVRFFAENVYGVAPGRPADLAFARTAPDKEMAMGGTSVIRRQMKATWTGARGPGEFPFLAFIPKKEGRVPALLFLNLRKGTMDPDRRTTDPRWDAEQIVARGYAAVSVCYEDISPDRPHDFNVKPFDSFETAAERTDRSWCAISAWAWGLRRVMDWIETVPEIDAKRVIVAGHSRGGKTALWAGAQDERFAMVVPLGSGRTGMMLNHIRTPVPTETIALINSGQPHWFTPRYKALNNREFETTFDHHQLAACVAPRLLYVCEGTGDMSRFGDWYALCLAAPAWERFGIKALGMAPLPETGKPAWSEGTGYHVRHGPHSITTFDWKAILDFADARLLKPNGSMPNS